MAQDYDLLLAIFPFEKEWYARRVPRFRVEFVGHPMLDRHAVTRGEKSLAPPQPKADPLLLLLPGSRAGELKRHLPVMIEALARVRASMPGLRARMVLPNSALQHQAQRAGLPAGLEVRIGGLPRVNGPS